MQLVGPEGNVPGVQTKDGADLRHQELPRSRLVPKTVVTSLRHVCALEVAYLPTEITRNQEDLLSGRYKCNAHC